VGFRLKEARKFQKEQALQYPLKKLGGDFIAKSVGKQRQNWLKLGVIPLIGVSIITFFGIRTYIVQSNLKIVQETQGEKYDIRKIKSVESLVFWKESFKNIPLAEADLYTISIPYANLDNANLIGVNLFIANLESANLESANLSNANLSSANLSSANLSTAYLSTANLPTANLSSAILFRANLFRANLSSTNLESANLKSAYLFNANLTRANFIEAKNLTNAQIKSACFWDKAIYKGHYDEQKKKWITDEKANQVFIAQLKQDKASDPKVKPECRIWGE
jgi:uncharacterized protein YjbI with pentapeptide repeats